MADAAGGDADLVTAAMRDRAAFAPLYRRYAPEVYRYCLRRLGTREAAEDATSLTFERALAGLATFRGGSFAAWLFTIAHNTVVSIARQRVDQPMFEAEPLPDGRAGPEEEAVANERLRTLRQVLARLPEDQRAVIELRLAGLKGAEIAVALGRSRGAVRMLQFRAMERLRRDLAALESDSSGVEEERTRR